jgi:hypothetical protein
LGREGDVLSHDVRSLDLVEADQADRTSFSLEEVGWVRRWFGFGVGCLFSPLSIFS